MSQATGWAFTKLHHEISLHKVKVIRVFRELCENLSSLLALHGGGRLDIIKFNLLDHEEIMQVEGHSSLLHFIDDLVEVLLCLQIRCTLA